MNTLFIDTHDEIINIILFNNGIIKSRKEIVSNMKHSVLTMPAIDNILKENNLNADDLDEIIVVNGPGSFTGVRIGVTIAKTFAYSLKIPIKTIDVLKMKSLMIDSKEKIVELKEKNGFYIGEFKDNENNYFYLKNSEYEDYIINNNISLVDLIDYEVVYNYLKTQEKENPHNANPLYIKNIEVQR